VGKKVTLIYCWWECKLVQQLWKTIWKLFKKLNIDVPYDPVIPLLGIYPKKCDSGFYKGTCTPIFSSTIHNSQAMETAKMPHYRQVDKKMWYLYTMEFYSATKKNETLSFTSKWMELENIVLSEVSQAQMVKNRIFSLIWGL
jgi:hypothetical protein